METEKSLQRTLNKTSKLVVYIGVFLLLGGIIGILIFSKWPESSNYV